MRQIEVLVQDIEFTMTGFPGQPKLKTETLVGVALNETTTSLHRNFHPDMDFREKEITLSSDQAERLHAFYRSFIGSPVNETPYDCHSFTGFLQGWDNDLISPYRIPLRRYILSRTDEVGKAGIPYATAMSPTFVQHSMTAVEENKYLSVLGAGTESPLVLSEGIDTMSVYGSIMMKEIVSYTDSL